MLSIILTFIFCIFNRELKSFHFPERNFLDHDLNSPEPVDNSTTPEAQYLVARSLTASAVPSGDESSTTTISYSYSLRFLSIEGINCLIFSRSLYVGITTDTCTILSSPSHSILPCISMLIIIITITIGNELYKYTFIFQILLHLLFQNLFQNRNLRRLLKALNDSLSAHY